MFRINFLISALIIVGLSFGCTHKSSDPANTVNIAIPAKIKGLDPAFADDLYGGTETSYAYEGLLQYHYLKRPYVLIPNLAEAMPEVSKDGRTYTFKIKKGVLFQDDPSFKETGGKGRELVADDFIYSWKRVADPKNASPGWWIFDGKVAGANDWHDAATKAATTDYSKPIEGFQAVDRYTVKITLIKPNATFLYSLAMAFAYAVPHEAVDAYGKEFLNHAVGTGPYRLTEFSPSTRLIWDRNPTYRKEFYPNEGEQSDKEDGNLADAGKPIPLNDRIVSHIFEEQQPMWLNFLSGKLDASTVPKDNYAQAMKDPNTVSDELRAKGIRMTKAVSPDLTHTTFNMADPILGKNKLLRQALNLAFDEAQSIDLFYNGRAIAAQGPIPPGMDGYDPNFKNPYRVYNVAKAKELLAKAGYPGGKGLPPLDYLTLADSTSRQMVDYTQKMFKQIGVELKVDTFSWPELNAKIKNKQGQLWGYAWFGDYPDAEDFLQLFYSKNASPGPNDANYSNPEFDALYDKAVADLDLKSRVAIYKKMVAIVVEDCPWIFDAHRLTFGVLQPWLKNYKIHDFDLAKAKYFRVDSTLKK